MLVVQYYFPTPVFIRIRLTLQVQSQKRISNFINLLFSDQKKTSDISDALVFIIQCVLTNNQLPQASQSSGASREQVIASCCL
jgi:hypothetical protein